MYLYLLVYARMFFARAMMMCASVVLFLKSRIEKIGQNKINRINQLRDMKISKEKNKVILAANAVIEAEKRCIEAQAKLEDQAAKKLTKLNKVLEK